MIIIGIIVLNKTIYNIITNNKFIGKLIFNEWKTCNKANLVKQRVEGHVTRLTLLNNEWKTCNKANLVKQRVEDM